MAAPFLKREGNKVRLLPLLRPWLRVPFEGRYFEPFCGTAAVFLDLKFVGAVLGDADAELVECLGAVSADPEGVIQSLARHEFSRGAYHRARDATLEELACLPPVERAARTVFLSHTGFNGLVRRNAQGANTVAFGDGRFDARRVPALAEKIRAASLVLQNVGGLRCGDFEANLAGAGAGDLAFLDPPYFRTFSGYTADGFALEDHQRLARVAGELHDRGAKVVLTHGDSPEIRALYASPTWEFHEIPVRRNLAGSGASRRVATELLLANFTRPTSTLMSVPKLRTGNMTDERECTDDEHVQTAREKMQAGKRLKDADVRTRIEFVQELLRVNMDRGSVVKAFRGKFGGGVRAADSYIARAREAFAVQAATPESLVETRAAERQGFLAKLDQDVAECKSAGVWSALVGLRRLQADVQGLRVLRQAEPPAAPTTTNNTVILNLSDTERVHRENLLRRILERRHESAVEADGAEADEPGEVN